MPLLYETEVADFKGDKSLSVAVTICATLVDPKFDFYILTT